MLNATWRLRLIPKSSGAEKASFGIKNCVTTNDRVVCWQQRWRCGHYTHTASHAPTRYPKKIFVEEKKIEERDVYIITWDLHLVILLQMTY